MAVDHRLCELPHENGASNKPVLPAGQRLKRPASMDLAAEADTLARSFSASYTCRSGFWAPWVRAVPRARAPLVERAGGRNAEVI